MTRLNKTFNLRMCWLAAKFYEVIILNEMYGVYGRIKILVLDWKEKKKTSAEEYTQ